MITFDIDILDDQIYEFHRPDLDQNMFGYFKKYFNKPCKV